MGSYSDHSANERTFLAWLRTGIAVVAFGFVIEKFNLFLSAIGSANNELGKRINLDRVLGPLGRFEGVAMMVVGLILILVSYIRFVRTERMIDNPGTVKGLGVTIELIITVVLVLLVSVYCISILAR
jgi:putative membrane protein